VGSAICFPPTCGVTVGYRVSSVQKQIHSFPHSQKVPAAFRLRNIEIWCPPQARHGSGSALGIEICTFHWTNNRLWLPNWKKPKPQTLNTPNPKQSPVASLWKKNESLLGNASCHGFSLQVVYSLWIVPVPAMDVCSCGGLDSESGCVLPVGDNHNYCLGMCLKSNENFEVVERARTYE